MEVIMDAKTTAVIVVDMWDKHYCKTYSAWSDELAPKLSMALGKFRLAGVPILFMSADISSNYREDLGWLLLARYSKGYKAPSVEVPKVPDGLPQWYPGCACLGSECKRLSVSEKNWTRIHPGVERWALDLVGDWTMHLGFLAKHGIKTVLYAGGSANVCVLNARSCSVCQTMAYGYDTVLLGDLTIPLFPDMGFAASMDLVLNYYREHICPVYKSDDIVLEGRGVWPDSMLGDVVW